MLNPKKLISSYLDKPSGPKRYHKKDSSQEPVEAMPFIYEKQHLEALKEFCGTNITNVSKERHMDAVATAEIITDNSTVTTRIKEGDWVTKDHEGNLKVFTSDLFEADYEKLE
jgi:hypothetical protein